jgi:glutathione S-transferase
MITLYQRTDCPFCWKVRLALAELGLGYTTIEVTLGEKPADLLRLTPTGSVPVLLDGSVVIWDSGVAVDYLDARYGMGSLIPRDPVRQAWVKCLHAYSDKCVGAALRPLVFETRSKPVEDRDQRIIETSALAWQESQAWLESHIEPQWMGGSALSSGECALAARCGVAEAYGVGVSDEFPKLYNWFKAVQWRPAWDAAYPTAFITANLPRGKG